MSNPTPCPTCKRQEALERVRKRVQDARERLETALEALRSAEYQYAEALKELANHGN